jgi:hypothetical protein
LVGQGSGGHLEDCAYVNKKVSDLAVGLFFMMFRLLLSAGLLTAELWRLRASTVSLIVRQLRWDDPI